MQEAQYRHLPVAGHQFSLSKQSAFSQSMQELFSISVVQVCCKSMLESGPIHCPKVDINHLEFNANICGTSASFPIASIKCQHINCDPIKIFSMYFFSFLPFPTYFFLPYSLQVGDGMKNGCSRAHYSPRNAWAAPRQHGPATRSTKCLKAECHDNSGSTIG